MRVKVLGAGSIGNHLSHAARRLGWSVDLSDIDEAALERTRTQIYPARYGAWDEQIRLFAGGREPRGGYDLIVIGTPPDVHMKLAMEALAEAPRALLVEKPLCGPSLAGAQEFFDTAHAKGVAAFVGYDHVVGHASEKFIELAGAKAGAVQTLDVEFREFWGGIFAAHPWLDGPADTYLGFSERGGGACGEHSHAINLWQHFARSIGVGRVVQVQAMMDFVADGNADYDRLCLLNLRTESGFSGRVVQDVVTVPTRKWARLQRADSYVEWICGFQPGIDAVQVGNSQGSADEFKFKKTRPDDFILELRHIESVLNSESNASPISIERGLDTMLVIAAAYKSAREQRTVSIDYSRGYTSAAFSTAS